MPWPGRRYGGHGRGMPEEVKAAIRWSVASGVTWVDTARRFEVSMRSVAKVVREVGDVAPLIVWSRSSGVLSAAERESIRAGLAVGESLAAIGRRLGRATSTISREVARNGGRDEYQAWAGERRARELARRPKVCKLAVDGELRDFVVAGMLQHWSPEQITARLVTAFPDRQEMRVSHETIYQSLFLQARGQFRKELAGCLRSRANASGATKS